MYSQNSKSAAAEGCTFCIGHIYSVNFVANAEWILKDAIHVVGSQNLHYLDSGVIPHTSSSIQ
jgi:polysaccharide deacetylase 2 family uncharacterized protein YibQ